MTHRLLASTEPKANTMADAMPPPKFVNETQLPPDVGNVQESCGFLLRGFPSSIIPCGGRDIGMASELLDGTEVRPGIEQVRDEGPSQVVGGERGHASLPGPFQQHRADHLGREPVGNQPASLVDRDEKGPGIAPTHL